MQFNAKSKYIKISPYKLRPLVQVLRGKTVAHALAWLKTVAMRRVEPIEKTIYSAFSNAKHMQKAEVGMHEFVIKTIRVDQGPIFKYFKPAAQGRASMQRKRLSHLEVILEKVV
jgi:large subunit ribosomal protein L22